jgi:hypothetical protein
LSIEDDLFVFVSSAEYAGSIAYDPSTQRFRWGNYHESTGEFEERKVFDRHSSNASERIVVRFETVNAGKYTASNAFGVKREVESRITYRDLLLLNNPRQFDWSEISLGASKEEAMQIKTHLRYLYAVKLVEPYFYDDLETTEPTLARPILDKEETKYICASLREFWVFRSDTGEVLARLKANDADENTGDDIEREYRRPCWLRR